MILDYENMFSKGQAVKATTLSDNVVDLGPGDAGPSEQLSVFVNVDVPFTKGGFTVELKTADEVTDNGVLTNPAIVATFPCAEVYTKAGGKMFAARLPHGMRRYAALNYVLDEAGSGGTVTAGLVFDVQAEKAAVPA